MYIFPEDMRRLFPEYSGEFFHELLSKVDGLV